MSTTLASLRRFTGSYFPAKNCHMDKMSSSCHCFRVPCAKPAMPARPWRQKSELPERVRLERGYSGTASILIRNSGFKIVHMKELRIIEDSWKISCQIWDEEIQAAGHPFLFLS